MTAEQWEQIKIADRHAARLEWQADPAFVRSFFASWGPGGSPGMEGAESFEEASTRSHYLPGQDPVPVEWD